jgi:hypothetical protein
MLLTSPFVRYLEQAGSWSFWQSCCSCWFISSRCPTVEQCTSDVTLYRIWPTARCVFYIHVWYGTRKVPGLIPKVISNTKDIDCYSKVPGFYPNLRSNINALKWWLYEPSALKITNSVFWTHYLSVSYDSQSKQRFFFYFLFLFPANVPGQKWSP